MKLPAQLLVVLFLILGLSACSSPEEKAAEFIKNGQTWLEKKEYAKAALEFQNAIQLDKTQAPAWYGLALIKEQEGDLKASFGYLNKVVDIDPKHVDAQIRIGRVLLAAKQLDKAMATSDALMTLAKDRADVLALRAAILFKRGDIHGAVQTANSALEKEPANAEALMILASERMVAKEYDAALKDLDRGLAAHNNNLSLRLLKIALLEKQNRPDEVEAEYQWLIQQNPKIKAFRIALAKFYLLHGKKVEAENAMKALVAAFPGDVAAPLLHVQFLLNRDGFDAAESLLKRYVEERPDQHQLAFFLAKLYQQHKAPDKAKAVLQKLIQANPALAQAKTQLALMLIKSGDRSKGAALVAEVLATDQRNTEALLIRAALRLQDGKVDDAIADLRTVLADNPKSPKALLLLAKAHVQNGAPELAKEHYKRALALAPANGNLVLEYAALLHQQKDDAGAESAIQTFLASNPDHKLVLQAMAQIQLRKGDWTAAQEIAEHLRKIGGSEVLVEQILGLALLGENELDKSLMAFKRAHEASPNAPKPLLVLVQSYVQSGRLDEARDLLQSLVKSTPDHLVAQILLAEILDRKNELSQAEAAFSKAIEMSPKLPHAYGAMAGFYQRHHQGDKALAILHKGLQAIPGQLSLSLRYASLLELKKDFDGAIAAYEEVLATNPKVDVVANNLASLLTEHRSDEKSLQRAQELSVRFADSKVPHFRNTLGWVYYCQGRWSDAEPHLAMAAKKMPQVALFRFQFGLNLLAEGRTPEAKIELQRAVELAKDNPSWLAQAKAELAKL